MKAALPRFPRLLGILAAAVLLLGLAPAAPAQFMGGDPTSFVTPISRRSLDDYARMLSLTPDQQESVKTLHQGYVAAHAEAQKEMSKAFSESMEKFQETQDMKAMQKEMGQRMKAATERIEKLEKVFYADVRALLDASQDERWVRVERHRRRENTMRFAMVSGQGVDLVKVLSTLKVDVASVPGLDDQVERYEADVDRAVSTFEKFGKEQQEKYQDFEFDMSKMQEMMQEAQKMMKEMVGYSRAIRDVNMQYARTMEAVLPEEMRPKFAAEVNRRAHPRIYRESWESKAMGAALGFGDLSAEQRESLERLRAEYAGEAAAANKRWARAMEDQEEKTGGQMMEMMSMWGGPSDPDVAKLKSATNAARSDRKELDKRTRAKLLALLTDEQESRLPEEKKDQGGMFGMGGDFFAVPDDDDEK